MANNRSFNYQFLLKPLVFVVALIAGSYLVLWIESVRPSDFGFYHQLIAFISPKKNAINEKTG